MKRISLYGSILLTILMFSGCNDTTNDNVKTSSNGAETVIDKAQSDSVEQSEADVSDLLYREYKSGEKYFVGEATITKSNLLNLVDEPEMIIVLYNGEIQKEITYANADITIEITKEGTYCFLAVNGDEEIFDITNIVQGEAIIFEKSTVLPLN